jgi:hypothetical protein
VLPRKLLRVVTVMEGRLCLRLHLPPFLLRKRRWW